MLRRIELKIQARQRQPQNPKKPAKRAGFKTPFLLALQFLTVATIKSDLRAGPGDMARSRAWFGVVGGLLGGVLSLAALGLSQVLPPLALAGPLVIFWAACTRFLHLDGVADVADALVHHTSRTRSLEIMKDSRTGAFGVSAVAMLLLTKFGALASLPVHTLWIAPLVAAPLARTLAAGLSVLMPPATPRTGLGAASGGERGVELNPAAHLLFAAACSVGIAFVAAGVTGLWCAVGVLALGVVLGLWYNRRLQGVTGDCLGAAIETAEVLCLLLLVAAA